MERIEVTIIPNASPEFREFVAVSGFIYSFTDEDTRIENLTCSPFDFGMHFQEWREQRFREFKALTEAKPIRFDAPAQIAGNANWETGYGQRALEALNEQPEIETTNYATFSLNLGKVAIDQITAGVQMLDALDGNGATVPLSDLEKGDFNIVALRTKTAPYIAIGRSKCDNSLEYFELPKPIARHLNQFELLTKKDIKRIKRKAAKKAIARFIA
jgi:hypothetical protein